MSETEDLREAIARAVNHALYDDRWASGEHVADAVLALPQVAELRGKVERVEAYIDDPRNYTPGEDHAMFVWGLRAALAPRPSAHTQEEGDRCGPVEIDEHNPSDPNCDYAPQDATDRAALASDPTTHESEEA